MDIVLIVKKNDTLHCRDFYEADFGGININKYNS